MDVGSSRPKAVNMYVYTHIHAYVRTYIHTCADGNLKPRFQCASGREDSLCSLQISGHCVHILIIARSVLFAVRSVSDRWCRENQNRHFVLNNFFLETMLFMRKC
jgi:hypothetical protein